LNVLIISDDPKGQLFGQISGLRDTVRGLKSNVDLLVFSETYVLLNGKILRGTGSRVHFLEDILHRKSFDLVAVSLELDHLKDLFLRKPNILDFLKKHSPQARVYFFGASSVLGQIEKNSSIQLFLYPRRGVSKLTKEFKNDIVDFVKRK